MTYGDHRKWLFRRAFVRAARCRGRSPCPEIGPSRESRPIPGTKARQTACRDRLGTDDLRLHLLELGVVDHALRLEVGELRELIRRARAGAHGALDIGAVRGILRL